MTDFPTSTNYLPQQQGNVEIRSVQARNVRLDMLQTGHNLSAAIVLHDGNVRVSASEEGIVFVSVGAADPAHHPYGRYIIRNPVLAQEILAAAETGFSTARPPFELNGRALRTLEGVANRVWQQVERDPVAFRIDPAGQSEANSQGVSIRSMNGNGYIVRVDGMQMGVDIGPSVLAHVMVPGSEPIRLPELASNRIRQISDQYQGVEQLSAAHEVELRALASGMTERVRIFADSRNLQAALEQNSEFVIQHGSQVLPMNALLANISPEDRQALEKLHAETQNANSYDGYRYSVYERGDARRNAETMREDRANLSAAEVAQGLAARGLTLQDVDKNNDNIISIREIAQSVREKPEVSADGRTK